jgi:hypothetical protein
MFPVGYEQISNGKNVHYPEWLSMRGLVMNKLITSQVKIALLIAGLAALFPLSGVCADSTNDSFIPSLASPSLQEDTAVLNRRLLAVKKDLEQFLVFAEYFNSNGDTKTVEQFQVPVDDFLKRHVNRLLLQGVGQANLDTTRVTAEIMFIKARLFLNLNQVEAARITVAEMKKNFGPYQKNMVQISGKPIMLSEAIRQLDEELAKPTRSKNK